MSEQGQQQQTGQPQNFALRLEQTRHGRNFLSSLLGVDQDLQPPQAVSSASSLPKRKNMQPSGWSGALSSMKLSDAVSGINITPNFLFLLLFVGLTLWLYVVYWIRHNEPLANSVIGTGAAVSATAAADRRIVAGIKKTFPVRTSADSGDIYVPTPHGPSWAAPMPPAPVPPMPAPSPAPTPLGSTQYYSQPSSYGHVLPAPVPYYSAFGQPDQSHHAYMVPVHEASGTRVKMIVNR